MEAASPQFGDQSRSLRTWICSSITESIRALRHELCRGWAYPLMKLTIPLVSHRIYTYVSATINLDSGTDEVLWSDIVGGFWFMFYTILLFAWTGHAMFAGWELGRKDALRELLDVPVSEKEGKLVLLWREVDWNQELREKELNEEIKQDEKRIVTGRLLLDI